MGLAFSVPTRPQKMVGEMARLVNQLTVCGFISAFKMFCRAFSASLSLCGKMFSPCLSEVRLVLFMSSQRL
jgi:hypothetical protein